MKVSIESIITEDMEHCMICGNPNVVIHHAVFGMGNRNYADQDKLLMPLCPKHHNMDSKESVHLNPALGKWSKIVGQLAYEKKLVSDGMTEDGARAAFRHRYMKSFL